MNLATIMMYGYFYMIRTTTIGLHKRNKLGLTMRLGQRHTMAIPLHFICMHLTGTKLCYLLQKMENQLVPATIEQVGPAF